MSACTRSTVILNGTEIPYELERKAVKRITLRVRRGGMLHVTVPLHTTAAYLEKVLQGKAVWIIENRQKMLERVEKPFSLQQGDTLPLYGISHTVVLLSGEKPGAVCRNGQLILTLPDPADEEARLALLHRFVLEEATRYLTERARLLHPLFLPIPEAFPRITVRWMSSRWGSCTPSRRHISLNAKLLFVPPVLADYVICHEFCHYRHLDHSAAFYRHLSAFVTDHVAARKALRETPIPPIFQKNTP